jgi:hypothetical protein
MHAKPMFMAAALVTLSATAAFAQSSASPSAPMQDQAPTSSSSPDASMQSGQPSDTAPSASTPATPTVPATPADLKLNSVVYDATGAKVGTIESVTSAGAVVSTGTARAQIPAASFAKNAQGLVIGMTKAQLEAAVAKAAPAKS